MGGSVEGRKGHAGKLRYLTMEPSSWTEDGVLVKTQHECKRGGKNQGNFLHLNRQTDALLVFSIKAGRSSNSTQPRREELTWDHRNGYNQRTAGKSNHGTSTGNQLQEGGRLANGDQCKSAETILAEQGGSALCRSHRESQMQNSNSAQKTVIKGGGGKWERSGGWGYCWEEPGKGA